MKKTLIASTITVVSLVWIDASWHAGKQIEEGYQAAAWYINQHLQDSIFLGPTFAIMQYDRGFFSSRATLTFKLPEACGPSKEIVLNEKISHGPFPWPLIKQGKWTPALASSQTSVVKNDYTKAWFDGANGVMPWRGNTTVYYTQAVQAGYVMAPFTLEAASGNWTASGATLDILWDGHTNTLDITSVVDMLRRVGKSPGPDTSLVNLGNPVNRFGFQIQGFESQAQLQGNEHGRFLGDSSRSLKNLQLLLNKSPLLTLSDYSDSIQSKETERQVSTQFSVTIGSTKIAEGAALPRMSVTAGAENLDSQAFQELLPSFVQATGLMMALCPSQITEASIFKQDAKPFLAATLPTLFSDRTKVSLSPFLIEENGNEISLDIKASLIKPAGMSSDLSWQEFEKQLPQAVGTVDARLSLSKATMTNLIEKIITSMGPYSMADPASLRRDAEKNINEFGALAVAKGLARSEGDILLSHIQYASGTLQINDRIITLAELSDALFARHENAGNETVDDANPAKDETQTDEPEDQTLY